MVARLRSTITRRDLLNGMALGVAAGTLSPAQLFAATAPRHADATYPPGLEGLRGSHAGAFEVAHSVAWQGKQWDRPAALTDTAYDLVIVGAGLSGLAAAHLFRERAGADPRVLIIDNHDDFGGHAKRNEFPVGGRTLIGYGGSQSIDTPGHYSPGAKRILEALGVDVKKFHQYFDQKFYSSRGMRAGLYLDRKNYGADRLTDMPFSFWSDDPPEKAVTAALADMPVGDDVKAAMRDLVLGDRDFLAGKTVDAKTALLRKTSYEDFLRRHAKAPDDLILLLRRIPLGIWGVGWDCLSALEAARWGMPGTRALGVDADDIAEEHDEPYIFHFPDGNASLARLLVRRLRPDVVDGSTMEDIVGANVDYRKLDDPKANTRIRLSATAVDIRHAQDGKAVDIVYVNDGVTYLVRGAHAIMAGYMAMSPYIVPEMPAAQKEAVRFFTKVPLVYVNVALRNWRPMAKSGFHRIYSPKAFFNTAALDFPVSIGDYQFAKSPDEPILLHLEHVPIAPDLGLDEKEQHRAGRQQLYALSYDDFEGAIVEQLTGMFAPYGFDAERDIAGITVNRWPHGYAYEYNELFDDKDWSPAYGPHIAARASLGRISFANSDTSAYAYVNGAFDAAIRAIDEQVPVKR